MPPIPQPMFAALSLAACVVSSTAQCPNYATPVPYDDFNNGTTIDPTLWWDDPHPMMSQAGGSLLVWTNSPFQSDSIGSRWGFKDDFLFVLNFSNYQSNGFARLELEVSGGADDSELSIERQGNQFVARGLTSTGTAIGPQSQTAMGNNGTLQIRREPIMGVLTVLAEYTDPSQPNPVPLISVPDFLGPVVGVSIKSLTASAGASLSVVCDSIDHQGTRIPPPVEYGASCQNMEAGWSSYPVLGATRFGVWSESVTTGQLGLLVFGWSSTHWNNMPVLPYDLGNFSPAWSGCDLNVSPDWFNLVVVAGSGTNPAMGAFLHIPNNPGLVGLMFFAQLGYIHMISGNLHTSNGLAFTVHC